MWDNLPLTLGLILIANNPWNMRFNIPSKNLLSLIITLGILDIHQNVPSLCESLAEWDGPVEIWAQTKISRVWIYLNLGSRSKSRCKLGNLSPLWLPMIGVSYFHRVNPQPLTSGFSGWNNCLKMQKGHRDTWVMSCCWLGFPLNATALAIFHSE